MVWRGVEMEEEERGSRRVEVRLDFHLSLLGHDRGVEIIH